MTVKPQFAAVFGLFLLLTGYWRAIFFAIPFTAAMIGMSLLAFGIKPWINFFQWTVPFHARLLSEFRFHLLYTTISPYMGAGMAGLPRWAAQAIQGLFSITILGGAAFVFIKRGATPRTSALGLFAVILALPYSNAYDLAIIAAPLTLAFFAERPGDDRLFLPMIPAFLLWVPPPFAWYFGVLLWPVAPVVFAASFLWALARENLVGLRMARGRCDHPVSAVQPALRSSPGRA